MVVTTHRNVIRFAAGDVAILTGACTVTSVIVVAGAAAARLRLYDAVNDTTGIANFEFGDVAANTTDGVAGIRRQFQRGISAALTGTGAVAYIEIE